MRQYTNTVIYRDKKFYIIQGGKGKDIGEMEGRVGGSFCGCSLLFFFFFVPLFLFVSFFKFKHQTWTKTTPINKYKSAWFIGAGMVVLQKKCLARTRF